MINTAKTKSRNSKMITYYKCCSEKFNFMQVQPLLTTFHCVPYFMRSKQVKDGPKQFGQ